ncbi:hypothetical protein LXT23_44375 [Pyxidicoccus sp. QH1ED-7-1]|nr:hypothetical protein [Pyxidicoccus xibeiensis]
MGQPLAAAIEAAEDLELVAAVARRARGEPLGRLTISGSVEEALAVPSDVFVDYTSAAAVKDNVLAAVRAGRHVVVGSSGLTDEDIREIDGAARSARLGVLAVGNFAITAALLQRFAIEAARHLPSWEIIDSAYAGKMDAPSGTARELAWRLSEVRPPEVEVPVEKTVGDAAARGAAVNQSRIHSVRLPGYTIGLEIRFGQQDERLTLAYDGGPGATPYVAGTLLAIRRVREFTGVIRGMDRLL